MIFTHWFFTYACAFDITKILLTLYINSLPPITITQRTYIYIYTYIYVCLFVFTLEPGSQLSEELWHPVQKGTQCHFHVGLRLKYTWSSPQPGVSSLKLEDLHLSIEEIQSYLLLTGFLLNSPINQETRFKSTHYFFIGSKRCLFHVIQREQVRPDSRGDNYYQ